MAAMEKETCDMSDDVDLDTLREQTYKEMGNSDSIDYIENEISYDDFFRRYMLVNKPCILGPWATKNWRSTKEWVSSSLSPNLEFLASKFGDAEAPVANCGKEQYSSHLKEDMKFSEFIKYLSSRSEERDECLYLKDWHFVRTFPEYEAYTTPVYFESDWLNEFWDSRDSDRDDYRFVYIGPKDSWTPFHADVLRSYSWSANVCGLKLWWFYPPGGEGCLKDRFGQLPYDLRSTEMDDIKKFPNYRERGRRIEVHQRRGEVIFVPSGWHHQVFNLEDTISINHNWLNGCCVDLSWRFVKDSLCDVKREIADCSDMDGWNDQCQLILKASSGIDYTEFYKFVYTIADRRIKYLLDNVKLKNEEAIEVQDHRDQPSSVEGTSTSSEDRPSSDQGLARKGHKEGNDARCDKSLNEHYHFDLMRIKFILKDMINDPDFQELNFGDMPEHPKELMDRIMSVL